MGLDFKISHFAYPLPIIKLHRQFLKNQYLDKTKIEEYQFDRLKVTLNHSYDNVPYYRKIFSEYGISPEHIHSPADVSKIPLLTKQAIASAGPSLFARHCEKYKPKQVKTSGTSGGQITLYMDKTANILEFVYYWRLWGWAGYKLGDLFAEFSAQDFTPIEKNMDRIFRYDLLLRRLMVNSLLLSRDRRDVYIKLFKKYKPLFLKGLPSNLFIFALITGVKKDHGLRFKAIFSQGEVLMKHQKDLIEKTFSCPVIDSYGQMERTVAISTCEQGSYHIHADYGFLELIEPLVPIRGPMSDGTIIREVVGTSLHNYAMPLIRYKTGDLVIIKEGSPPCPCKRGFPVVSSILGRITDTIITPDRRAVTALYVAFDRTPNLIMAQAKQDKIDHLIVSVAIASGCDSNVTKSLLIANLREFVGPRMRIDVVESSTEQLRGAMNRKYRSIVSDISPAELLS